MARELLFKGGMMKEFRMSIGLSQSKFAEHFGLLL